MFDQSQNQILPFFYISDLDNKSFNYLRFSSDDGFQFFVVCSLSSQNIPSLEKYLQIGIEQIQNNIERNNGLDILDRMKNSIFDSGDYLADKLIESSEPVDDVDFSVCILAIKDDILYIWNDGELNVRLYRDEQSILINQSEEAQFFGSTEIALGDIIAVSYGSYLNSHDTQHEKYVLQTAEPSYSALYIDYQVDNSENVEEAKSDLDQKLEEQVLDSNSVVSDEEEKESHEEIEGHKIPIFHADDSSDFDKSSENRLNRSFSREENDAPKGKDLKKLASEYKDKLSSKLQGLKSSGFANNILENLKKGAKYIHDLSMSITSSILDFFYTTILRKNQHQLKRFQGSYKKRNLQYLVLFVFLFAAFYFVFVRGGGEDKKTQDTPVVQQDFRKDIDAEFTKLQQFYNTKQIQNFDASYLKLQELINKAKSSNFSDTAFLDSKNKEATTFQYTLQKVTGIDKVDYAYFAKNSGINNAKIVDFSLIDLDVYAIDQSNSQVLKSASNQNFEVFAKDDRFKKLTQIACSEDVCFIVDEDQGMIQLDLANKTFSPYTNLNTSIKGVKEMVVAFGRLYTFVPSEGKVLRYNIAANNGLEQPVQWNNETGFDLNVSDIAIDGNIFEFNKNSGLRKFFGGDVDSQFTGLASSVPPLGKVIQIDTTEARDAGERTRFYVADSDNNRIVVYDKDVSESEKYKFLGSYKYGGQEDIKFDNFEEIVLSDDEKFIYVLENNTVYRILVSSI